MNRRTFGSSLIAHITAAVAGVSLFAHASAYAQDKYPNRPIRMIVPFPAGTAPDVSARFVAERMSRTLGQPVVVDNKPGASTIIGAQQFVTAPRDGYTIFYTANVTLSINPHVYKKLPYQVSDFLPVTRTLAIPFVIVVRPESKIKSIADLVAEARRSPGKLNYASYGIATAPHVAMTYFDNNAGISMTHVPYKDGGLVDIISGSVDTAFSPVADILQYVKTGKLRALAVSSPTRLKSLPDTPAVSEMFRGFDGDSWHGMFALKGTPQTAIDAVAAAASGVTASEEFSRFLAEMGLVPAGDTPAEFASFLANDSRRWEKVVKDNKITAD
jgi:tripartite-type tricarboxylate transporter receptor subunit TctC